MMRSLVALMLCVTAISADASIPLGGARKGVGGVYDMYGCLQTNDYYAVNFAAYQIDTAQKQDVRSLPQPECIDLPKAGKTQITLDLLDLDVRKKPVSMTVLREDGQVMAEVPMAIARQGVVSAMVDFKTTGKFEVILRVDDNDLKTPVDVSALRIPLTVGLVAEQQPGQRTVWGLLAVIAAIVGLLAFALPRFLKPRLSDGAG
ncbi:MAG: hypothetical protein CTY22_00050 [Methylomonas sp.]|nr:MAG: hypothetical protein CTY23_01170 [Methylomonas sp.]PPD27976.1 MAG: hypothetical protein CTY22_00050 [Methylomonas sp.]PPD40085.1 MAG: hypothetical protein CTY21_00050 [Methylomonas sp.]PPD41072.1 MAG: hypothetical protein CTY17_04815 [Methylomonas sp.]PPD52058.1 MAG: hypothetical protein CTY11_10640 [Methylomonas sp.]